MQGFAGFAVVPSDKGNKCVNKCNKKTETTSSLFLNLADLATVIFPLVLILVNSLNCIFNFLGFQKGKLQVFPYTMA